MVNSADFAKRLQNILDYYGLSATAFSEKIDFNRSTISHLLSGRNKPSLEFIMKVLQEFPEVELYWLLNGKGSFPSSPITEKEIVSSKEKDVPSKVSENFKIEKVNDSSIERIVIFFKDGSFKSYQ
ncbi:helix-turn-helix domain-containing protein [Aureisphaera sp. CAU 1614]|uniref:Helix-turn-helix domain-containing protein n=1 Tax=Halomarinibacterium sedimenti TaxID=2857106 RepID=A0A9X1FPF3_9FLAO|nr:helix-turn-helix transcriptional regulator [Halomarinibacterium sedimenti]MBW2937973.1 helix-turn-helix domain-containing protein [Halomarinibacterium sedimenti]